MPKILPFLCACLLILAAHPAFASKASLVQVNKKENVYKLNQSVKCGEYMDLSGDADVIRDGNTYRMFCTGLDMDIMGGGISQSISNDGMAWKIVTAEKEGPGKYLVLRGRKDTWEQQLETAEITKLNNNYFLYYSGYPAVGWPTNPGQIGVATSKDGIHFMRPSDKPVLAPGADWYDSNGLYSPATLKEGNTLIMVYAGHNYKPNAVSPGGIYVLGATSSDGISWKKSEKPVLSPSENFSFTKNGVAEPDLIKGGDGYYYLFFTGNLGDDEKRLIGVARSKSPFGPYQIRKEPVLTGTKGLYDETGVLAPSTIIENGKLRMWYLTSDGDKHRTGYAEMPWPLKGWN